MIEISTILLFIKDYSESGSDRYFLYGDGTLSEVSAVQLVSTSGLIICHDFWLIAPSIYRAIGKLPSCVVDLDEFYVATSLSRGERKQRDRRGVPEALMETAEGRDIAKKYSDIFYRTCEYDPVVFSISGRFILKFWKKLIDKAFFSEELTRQVFVEIPAFNLLYRHITPGIRIDTEILRAHKSQINHQYYSALKQFSAKHNLPLEIPSDQAVLAYLEPIGFDFSGISVDYVLEFIPTPNEFAAELLELKKLAASKLVLNALPLSKPRIAPIIDLFGSITSRIYFKDPGLQNLAKRHRNIIIAEEGKVLSYIDYDQFEVGIMAALSDDPEMLRLYKSDDIYNVLSNDIFGDTLKRKIAKRLFLSYAYGMKRKSLVDAAEAQGADRSRVKNFFSEFKIFESWKRQIEIKFTESGKIGTGFGNFQKRDGEGALSEKEKRSGISQVVQGTGSLIFKKALIQMRDEAELRILVPMHDAVLVEHHPDYDPDRVVQIFINTMTNHFDGKIIGKASLQSYY